MSSAWSISVKDTSTATLVELYQLLRGAKESQAQALEIQKELVERARGEGLTTQEIIDALVAGIGRKRERAEIAKEWHGALGVTEEEAKRRAV